MNYMNQVAEMLDVKLDEEFLARPKKSSHVGNVKFILREDGFYRDESSANSILVEFLIGKLEIEKLPWTPRIGEEYYHPSISSSSGFNTMVWRGYIEDHNRLKRIGVYKTKEQALKKAKDLGWIE